MTQLTPGFQAVMTRVLALDLTGAALAYFQHGLFEHRWWSLGYAWTLTVPFAFSVGFVWFAFVPATLQYDETTIRASFAYRPEYRLPWAELTHWGSMNGVMRLQFRTRSFSIFPAAFAKQDWSNLVAFLSARFPGQACEWLYRHENVQMDIAVR